MDDAKLGTVAQLHGESMAVFERQIEIAHRDTIEDLRGVECRGQRAQRKIRLLLLELLGPFPQARAARHGQRPTREVLGREAAVLGAADDELLNARERQRKRDQPLARFGHRQVVRHDVAPAREESRNQLVERVDVDEHTRRTD